MLPRVRYLLAKRGRAVAIGIAVVGVVLLGAAGAVYATPQTTEVSRVTSEQTVSVTPETSATVVGNSTLYERGTTLRNQPVYLSEATPRLRLALDAALPTADSTAAPRVEVVYAATRGGETFWRRTVAVPTERRRNGSHVVATSTLDVSAIDERLSEFRSEFGDAARVSASVRVTVPYTVPGHEGELQETYPLTVESSYYALSTEPLSKTYREREERTVTVPRRSRLAYLGPGTAGLLLLLAGAAAGVVYGRHGGATEALTTRVHRRRYAEWISEGNVPEWGGEVVVSMASLEGLVDVAIDTDRRVVYDPDRDVYVVLVDGTRYRYRLDNNEM